MEETEIQIIKTLQNEAIDQAFQELSEKVEHLEHEINILKKKE